MARCSKLTVSVNCNDRSSFNQLGSSPTHDVMGQANSSSTKNSDLKQSAALHFTGLINSEILERIVPSLSP